jgi:hypothetical protein
MNDPGTAVLCQETSHRRGHCDSEEEFMLTLRDCYVIRESLSYSMDKIRGYDYTFGDPLHDGKRAAGEAIRKETLAEMQAARDNVLEMSRELKRAAKAGGTHANDPH